MDNCGYHIRHSIYSTLVFDKNVTITRRFLLFYSDKLRDIRINTAPFSELKIVAADNADGIEFLLTSPSFSKSKIPALDRGVIMI